MQFLASSEKFRYYKEGTRLHQVGQAKENHSSAPTLKWHKGGFP